MWVISKKALKTYWESLEGRGAKDALEAWYKVTSKAEWGNFSDVKATFGANADLVGDCVVFDICGNKHRLVVKIRFQSHKVFVRKLMTHQEYDKNQWPYDCGCLRSQQPKKTKPAKQGKRR